MQSMLINTHVKGRGWKRKFAYKAKEIQVNVAKYHICFLYFWLKSAFINIIFADVKINTTNI